MAVMAGLLGPTQAMVTDLNLNIKSVARKMILIILEITSTILVALQKLEECRNPERFAGWLLTIVRNRSRNLVRREVLRNTDQVPESTRSSVPTPDRETERSELRGQLAEALEGLSQVQREIVLLHDLEGWKHREIAERLEIPAGTVRSHLHFARKALRDALMESSIRDVGKERA